jgi:hypothetical protein
VATHARLLPPSVYAVEGHLPGVEVADGVLDLQDVRVGSSTYMFGMSLYSATRSSHRCPLPLLSHNKEKKQ